MSLLAIGCLILVLFALISIGLTLAGYALYAAFLPLIGSAWAAAVAAFIFLVLAGIICLAASAQVNARMARGTAVLSGNKGPANGGGGAEDATLAILAGLAKDRPFMALVAAVVAGAAGAFLRKR